MQKNPINQNIKVGSKHCNVCKAFIKYLNNMDDIYDDIYEYNPNKKWKILIVIDDIIADMLRNKKLNAIIIELFLRGRNINISLIFMHKWMFLFQKMLD